MQAVNGYEPGACPRMIRTEEELTFYSGGSMWPTLMPGDRLVLEECEAGELRPGEVVVYRCGSDGPLPAGRAPRLAIHRVLSVTEEEDGKVRVRTEGDCSRLPDPDWPGERLVGRVVRVLPVRGRPRRLKPSRFLGWRLRHRLSIRRILRGIRRRTTCHRGHREHRG